MSSVAEGTHGPLGDPSNGVAATLPTLSQTLAPEDFRRSRRPLTPLHLPSLPSSAAWRNEGAQSVPTTPFFLQGGSGSDMATIEDGHFGSTTSLSFSGASPRQPCDTAKLGLGGAKESTRSPRIPSRSAVALSPLDPAGNQSGRSPSACSVGVATALSTPTKPPRPGRVTRKGSEASLSKPALCGLGIPLSGAIGAQPLPMELQQPWPASSQGPSKFSTRAPRPTPLQVPSSSTSLPKAQSSPAAPSVGGAWPTKPAAAVIPPSPALSEMESEAQREWASREEHRPTVVQSALLPMGSSITSLGKWADPFMSSDHRREAVPGEATGLFARSSDDTYSLQSVGCSPNNFYQVPGDSAEFGSTTELLGNSTGLFREAPKWPKSLPKNLAAAASCAPPQDAVHERQRDTLTLDERMDLLRRRQKLAGILGGEIHRESIICNAGVSTNKDCSTRRPHTQSGSTGIGARRQSDSSLASLRPCTQGSGVIYPSKAGGAPSEAAAFNEGRRRLAEGGKDKQKRSLGSSPDAAVSLSATLPENTAPKAAALLGLAQSAQNTGRTVAKHEAHMRGSVDSNLSSIVSSSEPRSSQVFQLDERRGDSTEKSSGRPSDTATSPEDIAKPTTPAREERRRRVAKISRWLGSVIPPHLVFPNPDTASCTGGSEYGVDEAPASKYADYAKGIPKSSSARPASAHANSASHRISRIHHRASSGECRHSEQHFHPSSVPQRTSHLHQGYQRGSETKASEDQLQHKDSVDVKRSQNVATMFWETLPQHFLASSRIREPEKEVKEETESKPSDMHVDYRASLTSIDYIMKKEPSLMDGLLDVLGAEEETRNMPDDPSIATLAHNRGTSPGSQSVSITPFGEVISDDVVDDWKRGGSEESKCPHPFACLSNIESPARAPAMAGSHDHRTRRHQKLGRWFGERIPPDIMSTTARHQNTAEHIPSSIEDDFNDDKHLRPAQSKEWLEQVQKPRNQHENGPTTAAQQSR